MATKTLTTRIILRNDTANNWTTNNPVLLKGEIGLETDTGKYKIGDGTSNWQALSYYVNLDQDSKTSLDTLIEMLNDEDFGKVDDVQVNGTTVVENKVASISIGVLTTSATTQSEVTAGESFTNNIVLHKIAKTGSYADLLNKPNVVDNLNSTSSTDVLSANQGNVLKSMVQALPSAKSFTNIQAMITALNGYSNTEMNVGTSIYLQQMNVPDFWVYSKVETSTPYTYTDDSAFISAVETSGYVQVGYYNVAMLESAKVDLTDYYTKEETQALIETFFEEKYQYFSKAIDNKVDKIITTNTKPILNDESSTWVTMTWNGDNSIQGSSIWTDGIDIYYSNGSAQYILDKTNHTWNTKTWNISLDGNNIWTDGRNIYSSLETAQYVLDKDSGNWVTKTWNGYTNITASYIWTDGENIYYSYYSNQYVLNKATSTWETKVWNGLTNFYGNGIWTDGENIYYSYFSNQYVLNKATSTWETKVWNGLTNFSGDGIWTDGKNIYYAGGYVLNKATSTWETKVWNGATIEVASLIWTDGENIYYSAGTSQYVLDKTFQTPHGIDTIKNLQGQINKKMNNILNDIGKIPNDYLQDTVLLSTDTLVLDGGTSTITTA